MWNPDFATARITGDMAVSRFPLASWLWLVLLAGTWGTSYALVELALVSFSPVQITFGRIAVGAVFIGGVCLFRRFSFDEFRGKWPALMAMAAFGMVFPFLLISWGQTHIQSGAAGVLMAVMPLSVLLFSHLLLPEEPLTRWHWLGFLLAVCGVTVLMLPEISWPLTGPLSGYLAVLGGALCYGMSVVIARWIRASNPWTSTVVLQCFSLMGMTPIVVAGGGLSHRIAPQSVVAVGALGLFATGIAAVLFFHLVRTTSAAFVSSINFIVPIWALMVGVVFMNEAMPSTVYIALLFILGGIAVSQKRA